MAGRWWNTLIVAVGVIGSVLAVLQPLVVHAQPPVETNRCVIMELYIRGSEAKCQQAADTLKRLVRERSGLSVRTYDLDKEDAGQRLRVIARHFGLGETPLPFVYGCNQKIAGLENVVAFRRQLEAMLTVTVYTRAGCPRCKMAKEYLKDFASRYPALEVRVVDIVSDLNARNQLAQLAQHYRVAGASVPAFHLCDQLLVGFDRESAGKRLDAVLTKWTHACPAAASPVSTLSWGMLLATVNANGAATNGERPMSGSTDPVMPPSLDLPMPGDSPPQLPSPMGPGEDPTEESDAIDVPVFGQLRARELGLPLFTLAVGLVDGFNPCAMWVLVFLLSVLVNLRSRTKILAVAGTFVLISGLAYFAFMAAWLNVFLLVGLLRPVQIVLGLLAVVVGTIHMKDFFAFKRGVSLSIPDAAKPGIYARVRSIVMAEHLWGAVLGAGILAVLVNVVELLCTAGLPALYTQVLSMHELPIWKNYVYLMFYNAAYMADDALMVTLVVITLGHRKMQETQGRWLKMVSGLVVLTLGVVLLLKPDWLV